MEKEENNMLQKQKQFFDILTQLIDITKNCNIADEKIKDLKAAVEEMGLPVAVVGEFSAGKSTLLNNFIGKNILTTNVKPETAIASELYYSPTEYTEGVREDGTSVRLTSDEIDGFVCIRRYINSEHLQAIQPISLVDMPGFDSPHDNHHKAILSYLEKAVHYIVLTAVDSGTITKSMSRQLKNIQDFKKDFSFFVTKVDLRSSDEVHEVIGQLQDSIVSILGVEKTVYKVSHDKTENFHDIVHALDPEQLFSTVFDESIKDVLYETKCSINTKISTLKQTKEKNEENIEALNRALQRLHQKKDSLLEQKNNTFREEARLISDAVGQELNGSIDSLVTITQSGGTSALESEINSIIQNTIISKGSDILADVNTNLSLEFSAELKILDDVFDSLNSGGFIDRMQEDTSNWYSSNKSNIDKFINERKNNTKNGVAYRAITGALALTTSLVSPLIEVLIIMIPDIINLIFGSLRKNQQKEKIKEQIISQIPNIKRNVNKKAASALQQNAQKSIEEISAQFEKTLEAKAAEIEQTKKEQATIADIPKQIQILQDNLNMVEELEKSI